MTRFDDIKQMNIEDLAFFLSIIELGDLNSIPNIDNESINYYINYLKEEEDNDLIDTLHKLNKSRHDYKEAEDGMSIDTAITVLGMVEAHGVCIEAKDIAVVTMRKYQKIETIIEMWKEDRKRFTLGDNGSKDEYLRQISEVLEDGNND